MTRVGVHGQGPCSFSLQLHLHLECVPPCSSKIVAATASCKPSLCSKWRHADADLYSHSLHRPGSGLCCPTLLDDLAAAEPFRLRSNLAAPNGNSAHSGLTATSPPAPVRCMDTSTSPVLGAQPMCTLPSASCNVCRHYIPQSINTQRP